MMRIIPAIDIIDGKCVRLTKGDYEQKKIYNENPLEVAKAFEDAGLQYLHLVDLDGAKAQHIVNQKVLEQIAIKTNLKIDFGGGLKSNADVKIAFESGAQQVTGGSIAAKDPEMFLDWLQFYGSDKIILGADSDHGYISVSGWQEKLNIELFSYIKDYHERGVQYVIATDISKDGMLEGPATELYKDLLSENPIKLIASGGISNMEDVIKLKEIGCEGAIIGKAIYENRIPLKKLAELC